MNKFVSAFVFLALTSISSGQVLVPSQEPVQRQATRSVVPQSILDRAASIVHIKGQETQRVIAGFLRGQSDRGSGGYLGAGYVLGCNHVVSAGHAVQVQFNDASHLVLNGNVINRDRQYDLALIKLESIPQGAKGFKIARRNPPPGTQVYVTNYNFRMSAKAKPHLVSRTLSSPLVGASPDWIQLTTQMTPVIQGDSGGAVLDENANLIGSVWGSDFRTFAKSTLPGRVSVFLGQEMLELLDAWHLEVDAGKRPWKNAMQQTQAYPAQGYP